MVDPWGGYNQGMVGLGQTFTDLTLLDRQRKQDILNNRKAEMELATTEAEQSGMAAAYGGDLKRAYEQQHKMNMYDKLSNYAMRLKQSGMSPQARTAEMKRVMAGYGIPQETLDSIMYVDDQELVAVKDFKDGELPDPTDPTKKLPGGRYKVKGVKTGDPNNPFQVVSVEPFVDKAETEIWGEPFEASIGGKRAMVQRSNRGQIRPVIQDVSTTVVVRGGSGDSSPLAQTTFVDPDTGKPLVYDKKTGSYRIANVIGVNGVAPKPTAPSPEKAAKEQLIEQAQSYMPKIKSLYLDKKGNVKREIVMGGVTRFPFTKGRQANTLIKDAMEAKLRAESGAAVPDPEVKRMAARYMPQALDDDATIIMKLNNLEEYLGKTAAKMNRGKGNISSDKRPPLGTFNKKRR